LKENPGQEDAWKKEYCRPEDSVLFRFSSVDDYLLQVEKLGGKVLMPKTVVSGWRYLVICMDPENNTFELWEDDIKLNDFKP
jgi:predicted enzyme related to lactoylglutathione lyase